MLEVFDILKLLYDRSTLELFNIIASKGKIDGKSLQSINGFTKKRYYSRTQRLTENRLVKRQSGIFSLTSFGKVIYNRKLMLDAAVKEYYGLKAVDSIRGTKEISEEKSRELINNIITDNRIKTVLLGRYGVKS